MTAFRIGTRYIALPACRRLALASADVNAINNALNAGSKPEDLVMAPVCNFLENPTPTGMQKAQAALSQHLTALRGPTSSLPAAPQKTQQNAPKWQFWKR